MGAGFGLPRVPSADEVTAGYDVLVRLPDRNGDARGSWEAYMGR